VIAAKNMALKFRDETADSLDKRQPAIHLFGRIDLTGGIMLISSISAAGLSQYVLSSGNSSQPQALQTLQSSLTSGDLKGAQSAFQTLQTILQNSATSTGTTLSANSQLSTDLSALGSALSSGDLSTAQSAFATVLGDLKSSPSAAQVNEATAASQSLQLVEGLLGTLNSNIASSADSTASLLQSAYASQTGLNELA
jgi:hypothetical protein